LGEQERFAPSHELREPASLYETRETGSLGEPREFGSLCEDRESVRLGLTLWVRLSLSSLGEP